MPSKNKWSFQYKLCDKVCLSSGGLKRHVTEMRPAFKAQETSCSIWLGSDLVPAAEINLEPLILKCFFEKSIENDEFFH